ncbi:DEAD/DEAH box helicase [Streptomyces narbonensis]|uniref:DEAD/DEAH box helicase n=1 Tax=Streptomyces narbonensis TaxID=67333 RepID=A0ABV3CIL2_9ACTN
MNEHWADIPLGRGGGFPRTARERYGKDEDWVRRWSCYAQIMSIAAEHWGERADIYEEMGDPHLRIYQDLVSTELLAPSPRELGRFLYDSIIQPVLTELYEDDEAPPLDGAGRQHRNKSREAICAWYWAVESHRSWKEAARKWQSAIRQPSRELSQPERTIKERMWAGGLADPEAFPPYSAAGLRLITERLDEALRQYRRAPAVVTDLLDQLLPASVAEKVRRGTAELALSRAQYPPSVLENLGIDEEGHTDLMAAALPRLLECITQQESMLLLGPTSSGKSRVGRIAVCHAITRARRRHGRAVVLMPTKALVSQAVEEWAEFLAGTEFEHWRIVPGSRDYPHNDEAIARGEFDVAVIIPEKLAGLMAGGMTLDGCDLVVVDELQNLADRDRGPRLEMLLTTIRASYQMPILGLSATLTEAAAEDVREWLKISPHAVVRVTRRPVPLNVIVRDDRKVSERRAEYDEPEKYAQDVGIVLRQWRADPVLKAHLNTNTGRLYERALAVAVGLLKEDRRDIRSVLCFVGSRQDAQRLAEVAQALLDRDPGMGRVAPAANPFDGRFGTLDKKDADLRHRSFNRFPQTSVRDSVEKSLRTGVGYHSARLEQGLRSVVEKAFRDGLIRLLFATDTLKLGINLPADAVVVGSLTTPTGGRKSEVLNRDTVAQRLGRAGRLGLGTGPSPRGHGFLVIPHPIPKKSAVDFQLEELLGLSGRMKPLYEGEPEIDRALRALGDVDAVYGHYIDYTSVGATIASQVDDRWFATELLHWAVQQRFPFTRSDLVRRLEALYSASLGAVRNAPPPDADTVVGMLEQGRLIGPFPGRAKDAGDGQPESWVVTGLGRAISTSGLPFADARIVEQLVAEATHGAGDLTLLWIAARSQHVKDTMSWLSVVPAAADDEREREQRVRVLHLASVLVASDPEERRRRAFQLAESTFVASLGDRDLIGRGVVADQLRQLTSGPAENPGLDDITALLRACVMVLWMSGCPLLDIASAIETNTRVGSARVQGPREVAVHAADVRNLGENASYLFDAARELSGVRPQNAGFRRFEALSEAVELGMPSVLGPLVRLPLPTTHRERIVHLVPYLPAITAKGVDHIGDVVDHYLARPKRRPKNLRDAQKIYDFTLSEEERAEIRRMLDAQEQTRRRGLRLAPAFGRFRVPGHTNYQFAEALDRLSRGDADGAPDEVATLLEAFGLMPEKDQLTGTLTVTSPRDPALTRRIAVHTGDFGVRQLVDARGREEIVIACGAVTDGVRRAFPSSSHNPVVVQPAILLEALGRVMQLAHVDGLIADPAAAPAKDDSAVQQHLSGVGGFGEVEAEYEAEAVVEAVVEAEVKVEGWEAAVSVSAEGSGVEDEAFEWEFEDDGEDGEGEGDEDDEDDDGGWDDLSPTVGTEEGMSAVGHRLLKLLTAAPPVLGRSELNRLVAGLRVAAPPEDDSLDPLAGGEVR